LDIIRAIKEGNQEMLTDLYKLYRDEFVAWVLKNNNCSEEQAKDAFQEAIIAFYNNVSQGKVTELRSELKTYIFSIGRFKLLNEIKKEPKSVTFDILPATKGNIEPHENSLEVVHNSEYAEAVVKKYLGLQCDNCQKVLRMFYFEGSDMKFIAEKMGYKNADVAKKKKYECFKKMAIMVKSDLKTNIY
jgi:RNA polymerase sigma factor (sigma-70 family)